MIIKFSRNATRNEERINDIKSLVKNSVLKKIIY